MTDPLAITRGIALTDTALAAARMDEEQRLKIWEATLNAIIEQRAEFDLGVDLGLGEWLIPGVYLQLESLRDGLVRAEMGWPAMGAGPSMMRVPLRRFGSDAWDLDGGSWAPAWWSRVRGIVDDADWDYWEDLDQVVEAVNSSFDLVWMNDRWPRMAWWQATPGWVDLAFPRCHDGMKRGIRKALDLSRGSGSIRHIPVLANGQKLERVSLTNLAQQRTTLFSPSRAGYRAFVENVRSQAVPKGTAMSMAFSWWERIFDDERRP